jgi:hypothetical protein
VKPRGPGLVVVRAALGGVGLFLLAVGAWHFTRLRDPYEALEWLAGALVLHDALLAPLVLAAGLLVAALPARRAVRATLVTGGALTLVALPALLRPGRPANPSVLPLPYGRDLLLLLALTAAAGVTAALLARWARRRR